MNIITKTMLHHVIQSLGTTYYTLCAYFHALVYINQGAYRKYIYQCPNAGASSSAMYRKSVAVLTDLKKMISLIVDLNKLANCGTGTLFEERKLGQVLQVAAKNSKLMWNTACSS